MPASMGQCDVLPAAGTQLYLRCLGTDQRRFVEWLGVITGLHLSYSSAICVHDLLSRSCLFLIDMLAVGFSPTKTAD